MIFIHVFVTPMAIARFSWCVVVVEWTISVTWPSPFLRQNI